MIPSLFDRMLEVEDRHWWFRARRQIVAKLLEKHLSSHRPRILEMGCGVGGNLEMLSQLGELTAVEYDPHALRLARGRGNYRIFQGGLPNEIPDNMGKDFDCIVMLDVLEHVEQDGDALCALSAFTRPGGKLLITVPACPWLWSAHDDYHHHFRRYMRRDLVALINNHGWITEHSSYFNTLLFPLAIALRLKERFSPRSEEQLLDMPPPWLNTTLETTFALESHIVANLSFPLGLSLAVVARKAD